MWANYVLVASASLLPLTFWFLLGSVTKSRSLQSKLKDSERVFSRAIESRDAFEAELKAKKGELNTLKILFDNAELESNFYRDKLKETHERLLDVQRGIVKLHLTRYKRIYL